MQYSSSSSKTRGQTRVSKDEREAARADAGRAEAAFRAAPEGASGNRAPRPPPDVALPAFRLAFGPAIVTDRRPFGKGIAHDKRHDRAV